MNKISGIFTALAVAGALAVPAVAAEAHAKSNPNVKIVERGPHGHATKVRVDGKEWAVCSKKVTDNCINPRAAGLAWGDRPLNYWPGKPASEMREG